MRSSTANPLFSTAVNNMANNAENSDGKSKLIAVTGPTGSGKTTFINHVCKSRLAVGLTLESCTDKVQVAHCEIEHQKVTLIDTPGFDNTEKSQADVLREVAEFLEKTYAMCLVYSGQQA